MRSEGEVEKYQNPVEPLPLRMSEYKQQLSAKHTAPDTHIGEGKPGEALDYGNLARSIEAAPDYEEVEHSFLYLRLQANANFDLSAQKTMQQSIFLTFYADLHDSQKIKMEEILRDAPNLFNSICIMLRLERKNMEIVHVLLETYRTAELKKILVRLNEIIKLSPHAPCVTQEKPGSEHFRFDKKRYMDSIKHRAKIYLTSLARTATTSEEVTSTLDSPQHDPEVIRFGSTMHSIAEGVKDGTVDYSLLEKVFHVGKIEKVQGGSLVKQTSRDAMNDHDNYLEPDKFDVNDYTTLVKFLETTYTNIDPGWLEYLIDQIPNDLNNPDVSLIVIKDIMKRRLVGICKYKQHPDNKNTYYFGSFYVDPAYQKYHIGSMLQDIADTHMKPEQLTISTIAPANVTMARNIGATDRVAKEITTEGNSLELLQLERKYPETYLTKDFKAYPSEEIIAVAEGEKAPDSLPGHENIQIVTADSTPERDQDGRIINNPEFIQLLRDYFKQGYALTRVTYGVAPSIKPDRTRTYLVFEKIDTEKK